MLFNPRKTQIQTNNINDSTMIPFMLFWFINQNGVFIRFFFSPLLMEKPDYLSARICFHDFSMESIFGLKMAENVFNNTYFKLVIL